MLQQQDILGKSATIGVRGLNCIELSNMIRQACEAPLIKFSSAVADSFRQPEIPQKELTALIESQCDHVSELQELDLCIVGQPNKCSIGTIVGEGVLFLNAEGSSVWVPLSRAPFLDGSWRVREEWLA